MKTDLAGEVTAILSEYSLEVQRTVKEEAKEAAEFTKRELIANSPRRKTGKGKGKYARGWKVKKQEIGGIASYVVYQGAQPGLTHTLENGHLARNQYGTFGRVAPIKHIEPAADLGIQKFELGVQQKLR